MIHNEKLAKLLRPFTEEELIYKKYYELTRANLPLDDFLRSIENKKNIQWDLFIKESNQSGYYEKVTDLFYPFEYDIVAATHTRYHPLFLHRHQFYEIIYQLEGSSINTINNIPIEMKEGDICIIPPGPVHTLGIFDNSIIVNILVKSNTLNRLLPELLTQKNVITEFFENSYIFNYTHNYLLFHINNGNFELANILESLILECQVKDIHTNAIRKALLLLAFNQLLRCHSNDFDLSENTDRLQNEVQRICQYLQTSYQSTSLNDVANQFSYSSTYLCTLIKNNTGCTFNDILTKVRLSKACDLLATSNKKISEIAELVGYNSPEYFNRVFKKHIGVSSTQYRDNYNPSFIKQV